MKTIIAEGVNLIVAFTLTDHVEEPKRLGPNSGHQTQLEQTGILHGASLRRGEYGWSVSSFPDALTKAKASGYACLGGKFQFRLADGPICEMSWLRVDSNERAAGESWSDYCRRSCSEVLNRFQHLASETDFRKMTENWPFLPFDLTSSLVFVPYFIADRH